ncbi:MAG: outer membrane beta-barrel protein [Bacteroidales bacterium]
MKKLNLFKGLIVIAMFVFFGNNIMAQGAYVNVNVGYALCMGATTFEDFYNYTGGENSATIEQVYLSLGKGFNFGGTIGYMFNDNVGAELGLSYLMGGKTEAKDQYTDGSDTYTLSSNMFRFIPSIVVRAGDESVTPYAKFGAVIGTGSVMFEYEENYDGDVGMMKTKMNGGIAFGINGALGVLFELGDNLDFFAEINAISMSYAPTKGEVTEATYNGTDLLPNFTTYERETEFVKEYTYNYETPPSDTEPSQELKHALPFGSFGINVGVAIDL